VNVTPMNRRAAFDHASLALADELGQRVWSDADFIVPSRSRPGHRYPMVVTPDGFAVHQYEGCEGEIFNGVLGCWHSQRGTSMTQMVPYEARPIEKIEFSREQINVLKNTICRGASDAELQLFTYACQDIGLNPFLHQIWAIPRNVNVGTKSNPQYEKQLTIQVGIDGYRVIRDRLRDGNGMPLFEGMDGPQWSADGEKWLDYEYSSKPAFARVGVWRRGIPRPFVAVCRYDAYVQDTPLWGKMGAEQLAKCAEALALRRAFPAEMSGLPAGPVVEYDELASGDDPVPSAFPSNVIDGELTMGKQQAAGDADVPQPAAQGADKDSTPPADPANTPASPHHETTAKLVAVLKDVRESMGADYTDAVMAEAMKRWPKTVGTNGRFYPTRVAAEDAGALLAFVQQKQAGATVPPAEEPETPDDAQQAQLGIDASADTGRLYH
jgi:phage recombination protein Bet